jgi:ABC-type dipeptide/oligopeptide/nickel transport system permease component
MLFIVARFAEIERMEVLTFIDLTFREKIEIVYRDYVLYIQNILSDWDWGRDRRSRDAWSELVKRTDLTLRLNIFSFFFYMVLGIIFGTLGALYKGSLFDRALNTLFLFFSSIPAFVMIMLLILFFGYYLEWFPPYEPPPSRGLFVTLKGMFIPVLAVSAFPLVQITRLVRGEMMDAFNSDFILLLKTKGLNQRQIVLRHLLKHSIIPVLPQIIPIVLYVLGSSFIVEMVYNILGISDWLFHSLFLKNLENYFVAVNLPPMVIIGTFLTALVMIVGLSVDIVYSLLDPRITIGGKKAQLD